MNEIRRVTAHFQPFGDPSSVHMRLDFLDTDGDYDHAVSQVLAADAQHALVCSTRVLLRLNGVPIDDLDVRLPPPPRQA
jgi:hypothetical protein